MTRIWDLAAVADDEVPSSESVTIISDGTLTKKISLTNMKRVLVPVASSTELGKVRVGGGLEIDANGTLSVVQVGGYSLPIATKTSLGGIKVGDNLTINSNGVLDTIYPLTIASTSAYGVVKVGNNINVDIDGIISVEWPDFSTYPDSGIKIGSTADLTMLVEESGTKPVIKSLVNGKLNFAINDSISSGNIVEVGFINSALSLSMGAENIPAFVPDQGGDLVNLGTSVLKWNSVYATKLYGNLDGNASQADSLLVNGAAYRSASISAIPDTIVARDSHADIFAAVIHGDLNGNSTSSDSLKVGSVYKSASVTTVADTIVVRTPDGEINASKFNGASTGSDSLLFNGVYRTAAVDEVGNTVAVRDANGDLHSRYFQGIAVQAQFADLAEKYLSDKHYDVGTVVVFGGEQEITVTNKKADHRVAGVISGEPAYLMNNDSNGQPVALRGKVPVKVIGKVSKGDLLITSAIPGYAMSIGGDLSYGHTIFAKSIADKTDFENGIIMAVIL